MQGATNMAMVEELKNKVSIHAPYAGSDIAADTGSGKAKLFQSTPPMQGATPRDP